MKFKHTIGMIVMAAFASLLLMNFGEQVGGYMNFEEARQAGASAYVVGEWVREGPSTYDPEENIFMFEMRDEAGQVRLVSYPNPKPANFEDASQLVVHGIVQDNIFMAKHILVKCPSKYNTEGPALHPTASRLPSYMD